MSCELEALIDFCSKACDDSVERFNGKLTADSPQWNEGKVAFAEGTTDMPLREYLTLYGSEDSHEFMFFLYLRHIVDAAKILYEKIGDQLPLTKSDSYPNALLHEVTSFIILGRLLVVACRVLAGENGNRPEFQDIDLLDRSIIIEGVSK